MEKIVELKEIEFYYKDFKAIDNISLDISRGIYGLLGPNGAGKTTLMKILLGFLKPVKGRGKLLGYDIQKDNIEMKKKIGYMPEIDCLIPGMDAVALTAYLGELSGMPRQEAVKRAHEVLYYVGLEESRYRQVETYSAGMKQRLKLAVSLVHDPEILFLDEPTSGMDPQARKDMIELINDISGKNSINMIISSHILSDIEATCRDIIIINKGRVVSTKKGKEKAEPTSRIYDLKLHGDVAGFGQKLKEGSLTRGEKGIYKLELPVAFPISRLFKTAYENKIQIRHFRQRQETLEDTFVSAIREDKSGN